VAMRLHERGIQRETARTGGEGLARAQAMLEMLRSARASAGSTRAAETEMRERGAFSRMGSACDEGSPARRRVLRFIVEF
jgi:hypothetical protein